jgi:hypothetical protein
VLLSVVLLLKNSL